ncbi:MAG: hypothetical protein F4Y08_16010 [Caldilineaceae bacterium SB0662_bin_9]|uniref:Uncharacterized protein n=1 Tax=Caldilineaceae bacterium SB0662_bin_9 TaxID=2605258 RepID=A0A6B1DWS2_9CHLR|nr:hypothetical protein [Caldilineaceae bacterium SB0662_bin_9]
MTQRTHWLRSAGLALLALVLLSGGSFAAGDLFDDAYRDCPARTRLRDGQIADLTVARDAEEADEVNVAWAATDPATWGLGANAYRTSLVVLLDDKDGDPVSKTLSLGTRKATFEEVATGTEVKVQMAIVVDTAEGDYLISDILEASVHQSLTAPAFYTDKLQRIATGGDSANVLVTFDEVPGGTFYYVGYNENFGNYKATGLNTYPRTPRLRIGLAHGGGDDEDDDAREAVDFEAYRLRITDGSGDVVPEGNDVATVVSWDAYRASYRDRFNLATAPPTVFFLQVGTSTASLVDNEQMFSNVRINDGGKIQAALHAPGAGVPFTRQGATGLAAATLLRNPRQIGYVLAMVPDEHREFPDDVLASDETYTVTAWAVNEAGAVISPVASLKLYPVDATSGITRIVDYLNRDTGVDNVSDVVLTEFTVLK